MSDATEDHAIAVEGAGRSVDENSVLKIKGT